MKERVGEQIKTFVPSWCKGDNIYIRAETGMGKTYFINNQLRDYALEKRRNILFLCPRISLKENVEADVNMMLQNVHCMTYQKIIYDYKHGQLDYLGEYDYVVMDEFATFINDSTFNPEVEDIFEIIMRLNKIKIFMAADGDLYIDEIARLYNTQFKNYLFKNSRIFLYDIYDRVSQTYTYKKDETIAAKLHELLEDTDDKIICFINNNKSIEKLYSEFQDEAMIYVSQGSPLRKLMDPIKNMEMLSEGKFNDRILFTTSAIISGVSFKDRDIKHIVIDEKNIHSIYQMLSRKRMQDKTDQVDLYLKEVSVQSINGILRGIERSLEVADNFENRYEEFLQRDNRKQQDNRLIYFNDVTGEISLNKIRVITLKAQQEMYQDMKDGGFVAVVEGNLNLFSEQLEEVEGMKKLEEYLEEIEGEKLFKEDQDTLCKLINLRDYQNRLQKSFSYMEEYLENETDYRLIRGREYSKTIQELYGKTFWQVVEIKK